MTSQLEGIAEYMDSIIGPMSPMEAMITVERLISHMRSQGFSIEELMPLNFGFDCLKTIALA